LSSLDALQVAHVLQPVVEGLFLERRGLFWILSLIIFLAAIFVLMTILGHIRHSVMVLPLLGVGVVQVIFLVDVEDGALLALDLVVGHI